MQNILSSSDCLSVRPSVRNQPSSISRSVNDTFCTCRRDSHSAPSNNGYGAPPAEESADEPVDLHNKELFTNISNLMPI